MEQLGIEVLQKTPETTVEAQGIYDAFRLLDKDLIDKVLAIASLVKVEKLDGGITRISIDLVDQLQK
jgi:hypothetical protein